MCWIHTPKATSARKSIFPEPSSIEEVGSVVGDIGISCGLRSCRRGSERPNNPSERPRPLAVRARAPSVTSPMSSARSTRLRARSRRSPMQPRSSKRALDRVRTCAQNLSSVERSMAPSASPPDAGNSSLLSRLAQHAKGGESAPTAIRLAATRAQGSRR